MISNDIWVSVVFVKLSETVLFIVFSLVLLSNKNLFEVNVNQKKSQIQRMKETITFKIEKFSSDTKTFLTAK